MCDIAAWNALVEASWSLGDRMLYLTSPNFRGDDVTQLQSLLSRLGFDCGRVDGIFGPLLAHAISEFQKNAGISIDGICSTDTVTALERLSTQTGEGPGISSLRDTERFRATGDERKMRRVVVGQFGGLSGIARLISRALRDAHEIVMLVDEPDVAAHVLAANHFHADTYIGLEAHAEPECTIAFYAVPGFSSTGGELLSNAIADALRAVVPTLVVNCVGMRLPILRETRMPAVMCSLGPFDVINQHGPEVAEAIASVMKQQSFPTAP